MGSTGLSYVAYKYVYTVEIFDSNFSTLNCSGCICKFLDKDNCCRFINKIICWKLRLTMHIKWTVLQFLLLLSQSKSKSNVQVKSPSLKCKD